MTHVKKILPEYFEPLIAGRKPFEIRQNDENYQIGEQVNLHEYQNGQYTGRIAVIKIKEIFELNTIGLKNYVAFTFEIIFIGFNKL